MKLLRETIRRIIKEAILNTRKEPEAILNFLASVDSEVGDHIGQNEYGTDIFSSEHPDNCRVEFGIDITKDQEVYIKYIQTIGDGCFRKGYATRTMRHLLHIIDAYNLSAMLEVQEFGSGGPDNEQLSGWYQSLGFTMVGDGIMTRESR